MPSHTLSQEAHSAPPPPSSGTPVRGTRIVYNRRGLHCSRRARISAHQRLLVSASIARALSPCSLYLACTRIACRGTLMRAARPRRAARRPRDRARRWRASMDPRPRTEVLPGARRVTRRACKSSGLSTREARIVSHFLAQVGAAHVHACGSAPSAAPSTGTARRLACRAVFP